MNITIYDLFYSSENSAYIEALVPFPEVPTRSKVNFCNPSELKFKNRPFEHHPFYDWVGTASLNVCDFTVDNYGWSTVIPAVSIYNIDSFQVDDLAIRIQFEDGNVASFEIDNDWYSSIKII